MSDNSIRYKRLGYACLNVTDLAKSKEFYQEIVGLQLAAEEGGNVYFRCSNNYFDLMLCPSDSGALKRVGWQMESVSARDALKTKLIEEGHKIVDLDRSNVEMLHIDGGFSTWEPTTGTRLDFFCTMQQADRSFEPSHTQITRLGHVVIASPDFPTCDAFFEETLNFKASDRIGEAVVHLRCFPNPLHHTFGIGAAPTPRLHHVNFMVTTVDDIGKANIRMQTHDVPIVFGPGRHPQSTSMFFYFLDPDGLTLEYSFGMEEFPEFDARPPRDFPMTIESIDYWGGTPAPGFAAKGGIEQNIFS